MNRIITLAMTVAITCSAFAQFAYVPNANENVAGTAGLNTFIRDIGAPRTGQLGIGVSQLGAVNVGDFITGISFRLFTGATTNFPGATWSDYTIRVGEGVDLLSMGTTFANNFASAPTVVRTGALTLDPNAFTTGGNPNAWGQEITFQTAYQYTGGPLLIEIRHTGSNITNPANTFLDAVTSNAAGGFVSFTAVGEAATTGALATFTISRLSVSPVPEPATFVALGLGLAGLALARRRK